MKIFIQNFYITFKYRKLNTKVILINIRIILTKVVILESSIDTKKM